MGKAPALLKPSVLSALQRTLADLDSRYPIANEPEWASRVNYSSRPERPVHSWFRNREGYSVELVESLLKSVPKGSLVVDPFCGTGTTNFVSFLQDYKSVGIDVNPLATFVTRVKTRRYSSEDLLRFRQICDEIQTNLRVHEQAAEKPQMKIIDQIFEPLVLHSLLVLKHHINTRLARGDRDFFFLAWLSVLEKLSNVFREGNGIKYRNRKRLSTGYQTIPMELWQQSHFPADKFAHVVGTFADRVRVMINDLRHIAPGKYEPEIHEGDVLGLDDFVSPDSASLVAFSPPYINNFNYFKAYKVELWMGDFVEDYDEMVELTRRSLRSHVETRLQRTTDTLNWYPEELDSLVELMEPSHLWTPRIPSAVRGYFYDMHSTLEKVFEILEPNGQCVIVVGNSAYASILVPTDTILAETASAIGFDVERIAIARHLTTSSQQKKALEPVAQYLRESLVFLRKSKAHGWTRPAENRFLRQRYVSEVPKFPKAPPTAVYVIRNRGLTDLTHIIHRYPGKFIPHVPRWAIQRYLTDKKGCCVVDPFCGSGTTLVEARVAGHSACGIDINPLARLITKVKTTPLATDQLDEAVASVIDYVRGEHIPTFRPTIETLDHWFTQRATHELGVIRDAIDRWTTHPDIYDFLLVSLSAIVRKASNADDQSIKTYVSGTHKKNPPPATPLFVETVREYATRIKQFGEYADYRNRTWMPEFKDARHFAQDWYATGLPKVDLAITSPPYVKTVDYVYSQMAEFFWVGDVFGLETQEKQNVHKRSYIGTEKVFADEYLNTRSVGIPRIDDVIRKVGQDSVKHAYIVSLYFEDMIQHFTEMHQLMKPRAPYVVVVGDSSVSDIEIETHSLLELCANNAGFELENAFAYEIRNRYMRFPRQGRGGIVDLDWVLTFRRREY